MMGILGIYHIYDLLHKRDIGDKGHICHGAYPTYPYIADCDLDHTPAIC